MLIIYTLCLVFIWAYVRYFLIVKPINEDDPFYLINKQRYEEHNGYYEKNIAYYQKLDPIGRNKFVERCIEIQSQIEFQTREELELSNEMKMHVSACIAQLTFGFKDIQIGLLKGVILFPDIFYSRLVENWVKGLAMGNGVVFLSWNHFKEGYADSRDTYNLGLHEFAHILRLEAISDNDMDIRFASYYEEWNEIALPIFNKHRNGSIDFFREYANTNEAEFFSVCIENFFEIPDLFKEELPTLYFHLCYLLNQNPLNTSENYSFNIEDALVANKSLKLDIPVFEHIFSMTEKQFWDFGTNILLMVFFLTVYFSFGHLSPVQLFDIILTFVSAIVILLLVRYWYYSDIRSITNLSYIEHLIKRIIPLMGSICIVLHLIAS